MEINSNTRISEAAVFNSLDMKDGKADNKIQASIWNEFADQVGGKHIKNYIEYGNAAKSIKYYMKRGGEAVKQAICKFCGFSTEEAQKNLNEAEQLLNDVAEGKLQTKKENGRNNNGKKWQTATLSDGRYIKAYFDKDGEIIRINISVDTNKYNELDGNGSVSDADFNEVSFGQKEVNIEGESRNEKNHNYANEFSLTEGYEFEKYKKLAEKIFSEGE